MKKLILLCAVISSVALTGCVYRPYGYRDGYYRDGYYNGYYRDRDDRRAYRDGYYRDRYRDRDRDYDRD